MPLDWITTSSLILEMTGSCMCTTVNPRLGRTPEEFVGKTPMILDRSLILGSKRTTFFLVDAKTGTVISTYKIVPSTLPMKVDEEKILVSKQDMEEWVWPVAMDQMSVHPLYITRTDYDFQSFAPSLDKLLWNMTLAEIRLHDTCQRSESSPVADPYGSRTKHQDDIETRSLHGKRAIVVRFRDTNVIQSV
ncbi:uncharacterized protein LOC122658261 [Telopea speciosissima]|uniref:uncharacterized protein LOC122658261 n=1 Tax=Telopea speciosissima TaxID=54955 RepID=UPI001CC5B069|nr:uncharacterized protein LOC122658261 [Telopea speciosissima]